MRNEEAGNVMLPPSRSRLVSQKILRHIITLSLPTHSDSLENFFVDKIIFWHFLRRVRVSCGRE